MKTLIRKSIIETIRNRAAAQYGLYVVVPTDRKYLDRWYQVTLRTDMKRTYQVDTFAKTCECEAFNRDGYCKHFAMVQMTKADEAKWEKEAEKYTDLDYIDYLQSITR